MFSLQLAVVCLFVKQFAVCHAYYAAVSAVSTMNNGNPRVESSDDDSGSLWYCSASLCGYGSSGTWSCCGSNCCSSEFNCCSFSGQCTICSFFDDDDDDDDDDSAADDDWLGSQHFCGSRYCGPDRCCDTTTNRCHPCADRHPTLAPAFFRQSSPTPSLSPVVTVTRSPTFGRQPTLAPTLGSRPTLAPTSGRQPTQAPSGRRSSSPPSTGMQPTLLPSTRGQFTSAPSGREPTQAPSVTINSIYPTSVPTQSFLYLRVLLQVNGVDLSQVNSEQLLLLGSVFRSSVAATTLVPEVYISPPVLRQVSSSRKLRSDWLNAVHMVDVTAASTSISVSFDIWTPITVLVEALTTANASSTVTVESSFDSLADSFDSQLFVDEGSALTFAIIDRISGSSALFGVVDSSSVAVTERPLVESDSSPAPTSGPTSPPIATASEKSNSLLSMLLIGVCAVVASCVLVTAFLVARKLNRVAQSHEENVEITVISSNPESGVQSSPLGFGEDDSNIPVAEMVSCQTMDQTVAMVDAVIIARGII